MPQGRKVGGGKCQIGCEGLSLGNKKRPQWLNAGGDFSGGPPLNYSLNWGGVGGEVRGGGSVGWLRTGEQNRSF